MESNYCSQLGSLPEDDDTSRPDLFKCKITGNRCIASDYDNPDPGHPGSYEVASYKDYFAQSCPAYNIPDNAAKMLINFRLEAEKSKLEAKIDEINARMQ